MSTKGFLITAVSLILLTAFAPVGISEGCQPYPIGRCGDHDRESVVYCYEMVKGEIRSGTQSAVSLGPIHVRTEPTEGFAADAFESDLPFGSVFQEANGLPGLQMRPVTCGTFEWWAECDSWMGPYNTFRAGPDVLVT